MKRKIAHIVTAIISNKNINSISKELSIPTEELEEIIASIRENPKEHKHLLRRINLKVNSNIIVDAINKPEQVAIKIIQEYPDMSKYFCDILTVENLTTDVVKKNITSNRKLLFIIGNVLKNCGREIDFQILLKKLLESRNRTIRVVAAETAAKFFRQTNNEDIFESLKTLLKGDSLRVKMAAVEAIGYIFEGSGNQQVINLLSSFLKYEIPTVNDYDVYKSADKVIENISMITKGAKNSKEIIFKIAHDFLLKFGTYGKCKIVESIGEILGGTGDLEILEFLMENFKEINCNREIIKAIGKIFRGTNQEKIIIEKVFGSLSEKDRISGKYTTLKKLMIHLIYELYKDSTNPEMLNVLKNFIVQKIPAINRKYDKMYKHFPNNDLVIRESIAEALGDIFKDTYNPEALDILLYILDNGENDPDGMIAAAHAISLVAPSLYNYYILDKLSTFIPYADSYTLIRIAEIIGDIFRGTGDIRALWVIKKIIAVINKNSDSETKVDDIKTVAEVIKLIFKGVDTEKKIILLEYLKRILERYKNIHVVPIIRVIGYFFRGMADLRALKVIRSYSKYEVYGDTALEKFAEVVSWIFAKSCNKAAAEFLLDLLINADDYEYKDSIVWELGIVFDDENCDDNWLVRAMTYYLRDSDESTKGLLIETIGYFFRDTGDFNLIKRLEEFLSDESIFVRTQTLKAIILIYPKTKVRSILNFLEPYLMGDDRKLKEEAIYILGEKFKGTGNREVFKLLTSFLNQSDQEIKAAQYAIGELFSRSGVRKKLPFLLTPYILNKDKRTRLAALKIIQEVFERSRSAKVLDLLEDFLETSTIVKKDKQIRWAIVEIIHDVFEGTRNTRVLKLLKELLTISVTVNDNSTVNEVMRTIKYIFWGTGNPKVLDFLKELLTKPCSFNKDKQFIKNIIEIVKGVFKGTGNPKVLDFLKKFLTEEFEETYTLIATTIKEVYEETDSLSLLDKALEQLKELLISKSPAVRKAAIEAMSALFYGSGNKQLLKLLKPYLCDNEPDVRVAAVEAICFVFDGSGDDEALNTVMPIIEKQESEVKWNLKKLSNLIRFRV